MSYKNPIPSVDDVDVAKRFFVSPIFSFNEHMTIEEAAHGISELIRQNNGEIPVEWIKFADAPGIRRTFGKKITDNHDQEGEEKMCMEKRFFWDDSELQDGISEFVIRKNGFDGLTVYDRSSAEVAGTHPAHSCFDFCGNMPDGSYYSHEKLKAKTMEEAKQEVVQIYLKQCSEAAEKYKRQAEELESRCAELREYVKE